ncbi:MAG: cytochrome c-type biogenesis protein CcmH, partial [Micropepsaceae bacterium]
VFVLMRPPMRSDTYLLWFGPALLLLLGGGMVWAIVGRAKRRGASAGADIASEEFDETAPDQHT